MLYITSNNLVLDIFVLFNYHIVTTNILSLIIIECRNMGLRELHFHWGESRHIIRTISFSFMARPTDIMEKTERNMSSNSENSPTKKQKQIIYRNWTLPRLQKFNCQHNNLTRLTREQKELLKRIRLTNLLNQGVIDSVRNTSKN